MKSKILNYKQQNIKDKSYSYEDLIKNIRHNASYQKENNKLIYKLR